MTWLETLLIMLMIIGVFTAGSVFCIACEALAHWIVDRVEARRFRRALRHAWPEAWWLA